MKIWFASLLALVGVSLWACPNKDFTITATWSYDFTNFQPCSATVTTGCISGYQWGYLNSAGTQVQLHAPTTSVCTGTVQPETCSDVTNSQLPMGSITFYVVATFVDNSGKAGVTAAATSAPVIITAATPSNLGVTAK